MRESVSAGSPQDSEYRESKRAAATASPDDAERLDFLEKVIGTYESLDDLERATDHIVERLSGSRAQDAALRLRDMNATRVTQIMVKHAKKMPELKRVRTQLMQFPFAYDDLRQKAYDAFDRDMEVGCLDLIEMVSGLRDQVRDMRTIVIEFPFIDQEALKRVLEAQKREEQKLSVRSNFN